MLISKGSVKDLYTTEKETEIDFVFSDRVSVFDYGALPEEIPSRGQSLCDFTQTLFSVLKEQNIASAYIGPSTLGAAAIRMQKAAHPKFKLENKNLQFIPLEIIFRWGVPEGSKLLKKGYKAFEQFSTPHIEFTTKLEAFDRDLSDIEATELLPTSTSVKQIKFFTNNVALKLKNYFQSSGLQLWDGKIEVAVDESGELLLVDAITPDELRLTLVDYPRIPLSKELMRRWYQKSLWPTKLQELKDSKGQDWKALATPPPALGKWRIEKFSELFKALAIVVREKSPQALEKWIHEENRPKVFVAGQGGRETALKWKLEQEGCTLVNDATLADATLVSNDNDLAAGKVDDFLKDRIWATGPTQAASHIEWSKIFGKEIASLAKIPMAEWTTDAQKALSFATLPVIKQDGLAGGKGVALPDTIDDFHKIVTDWKDSVLLFEERLKGEEASVFFWIHPQGNNFSIQFLGSAKDYKRRFDDDKGPNTGGMGAQSPHPTLSTHDIEQCQSWAHETVRVLKTKGIHYSGALFMGLLRDEKKGWCLLEYNARFGDPETQALVLRWKNNYFLRSHLALSLSEQLSPVLSDENSLCLALVHPQYPQKGDPIELTPWKPLHGQVFLTGSNTGRIAYLCMKGKTDLGPKIAQILQDSPWRTVLDWRKDPLK